MAEGPVNFEDDPAMERQIKALMFQSGHDPAEHPIADLIPLRYLEARVSEPEVQAWVSEVIASSITESSKPHNAHRPPRLWPPGPSLALLGRTGVGKSHQMFGAVRSLCESGLRGRIIRVSMPDLYASLRPSEKDRRQMGRRTFDDYANADVLFLDDLGAAKDTEWTEEINFRLIDHRYSQILPTMITSNVIPTELAERLGDRVASRLREMATIAVMRGDDRRGRR